MTNSTFLFATALAVAAALPAHAATYPDRTMTMVVGASPAGGTDVAARLLVTPLALALGQQIVVENKPGANGNIGALHASRAKPDGYTIFMQYSGSHVVNPHLLANPQWALSDFTPVALVAFSAHVVAVRPELKANNLKELAQLAKTRPGELKFGSAGSGSIQHMAMETFQQMTGTKFLHVPYKSAAPAVTDLLGGQIDIVNTTPSPVLGHIKTGKLKALAYTSDKRHPEFPEVPTSAESGLPGYNVATWFGVLVPAKTPRDVIAKLDAEIKKIVESEEFTRKIAQQGGTATYQGTDEFKALIEKDYQYWGNLIRSAGIKGDMQ